MRERHQGYRVWDGWRDAFRPPRRNQTAKVVLHRIYAGRPRWSIAFWDSDRGTWCFSGPYYDTRWQARKALRKEI